MSLGGNEPVCFSDEPVDWTLRHPSDRWGIRTSSIIIRASLEATLEAWLFRRVTESHFSGCHVSWCQSMPLQGDPRW